MKKIIIALSAVALFAVTSGVARAEGEAAGAAKTEKAEKAPAASKKTTKKEKAEGAPATEKAPETKK